MDELVRRLTEDLVNEIDSRLGTVSESMVTLLGFSKKSELEKYCRTLTITKADLASLAYAAGTIGYAHQIKDFEYVPDHLSIDPGEVSAAFSGEPGSPLLDAGRKIVNKIDGIFNQRRHAVAHLFLSDSRWHIFYFDFRDLEERSSNHWKYGSHVHFVNYLWTNLDLNEVWDSLAGRSNKSYGLHIRFADESGESED